MMQRQVQIETIKIIYTGHSNDTKNAYNFFQTESYEKTVVDSYMINFLL